MLGGRYIQWVVCNPHDDAGAVDGVTGDARIDIFIVRFDVFAAVVAVGF